MPKSRAAKAVMLHGIQGFPMVLVTCCSTFDLNVEQCNSSKMNSGPYRGTEDVVVGRSNYVDFGFVPFQKMLRRKRDISHIPCVFLDAVLSSYLLTHYFPASSNTFASFCYVTNLLRY